MSPNKAAMVTKTNNGVAMIQKLDRFQLIAENFSKENMRTRHLSAFGQTRILRNSCPVYGRTKIHHLPRKI